MSIIKCLKGITCGEVIFEEDSMAISYYERRICKFNMKKFVSSTINKNDIIIDMNTADLADWEDRLCEMRLFVPVPTYENKPEDNEDADMQTTPAEKLNSNIITRTQQGQLSGNSIVKFEDVQLIVPRGKYSLDLSKKSVRFHGSSYNYTVEYSNIIKGFLLPLPDDINVAFVLGLDSALKYGNTLQQFIVMQFKKEDFDLIKTNITPEEKKEEKLKDLEDEYEGPLYEIVGQVFKTLCNNIQIIMPGGFQSSQKQNCLKCTVKTHQGLLFPMKKSLLFIHKPVIYIQLQDIQRAEFMRIGLNKLFDVKVHEKGSNSHQFFGIERKELDVVLEYFQQKGIKITYDEQNDAHNIDDEEEDDDEDVDVDAEAEEMDLEEKNDPKKKSDKKKKTKLQRKSAQATKIDPKKKYGERIEEEDEEEEEDEDFNAEEFESSKSEEMEQEEDDEK